MHANCERRAKANLARQGFAFYLPVIKDIVTIRGRKSAVSRPLFGRYIFVFIQDQWRSLLSTIGIASVVMRGDKPACIPSKVIDDIRAREDKEGFVRLRKNEKEKFERGTRVRIPEGQFSGMVGVYDGMTSSQREVVLLEFLGRVTRVEIAAAIELEPIV